MGEQFAAHRFAPHLSNPLEFAAHARDQEMLSLAEAAVDGGNVALALQPAVRSSGDGPPLFHEGLLRIFDPSGRIIPARKFIPVSEDRLLGRKLDLLALEHGLTALARDPAQRISVNMSARSIGYRPWLRMLDSALKQYPGIGQRLILEIAEPSVLSVPELLGPFMQDLRGTGISFALDGFGGASVSFRSLRDLFFDIAKLSSRYTRGVAADPDNQVVVGALLAVTQHFDMIAVADRVATRDDAAYLTASGVQALQGNLFGAPRLRQN